MILDIYRLCTPHILSHIPPPLLVLLQHSCTAVTSSTVVSTKIVTRNNTCSECSYRILLLENCLFAPCPFDKRKYSVLGYLLLILFYCIWLAKNYHESGCIVKWLSHFPMRSPGYWILKYQSSIPPTELRELLKYRFLGYVI